MLADSLISHLLKSMGDSEGDLSATSILLISLSLSPLQMHLFSSCNPKNLQLFFWRIGSRSGRRNVILESDCCLQISTLYKNARGVNNDFLSMMVYHWRTTERNCILTVALPSTCRCCFLSNKSIFSHHHVPSMLTCTNVHHDRLVISFTAIRE